MATNTTVSIDSSLDPNNTETIFNGWKHSGTDRGSIDIIWTCAITIVLCCWVSTHPNVASLNDKWYHRFIDKSNLACIGLLGPDFLLGLAMGQFAKARRSVKMFADAPELRNGSEWTLAHGFFADMGGFLLTSPDYPKGFPISSDQLFYLVKHGHVAFPSLTKKDLKDMSRVDTLSKVIVLWQVAWFCVIELQRFSKGLPMTTLELTTLSFSLMMIATSIFWFHKPTIALPVKLSTNDDRTVADIRARARSTTHPGLAEQWHRTPLYFISGPRYWVDVLWAYYKEITYKLHVPVFGRQMKQKPWDRIPDDLWHPYSEAYLYLLTSVPLIGFSLSLLLGWNFHMPSAAERVLWRFAITYHCAFSLFGGFYILYSDLSFRKIRHHQDKVDVELGNTALLSNRDDIESPPARKPTRILPGRARRLWSRVSQLLEDWRNISSDRDPELEAQLRVTVPLFIGTCIYIFCRAFIYIEDFISLRSQPQGVYITVNRFAPL